MVKKRRVEGVIIGRRDFGETDRIIVIFSREEGKISSLAKGVRKINSRRLGSLELGNQVKLLVYQGKNFDIITEAAVIDYFGLKTNSVKLGGIFFLCELINVLLPERERNIEIYREFLKIRKLIKNGKIEKIVFFEAKLLQMLGYGLEPKVRRLLEAGELNKAQQELRRIIEAISQRPIKSLSFFD